MSSRGSALIMALYLMAFLLTLGIARIFFVQQSYFVASKARLKTQAYYLALSGMHYYWYESALSTNMPFITPGVPITRAVPEGDSSHFFEISMDNNFNVYSKGYIVGVSKRVLTQYRIMDPNGMPLEIRDAP